VVGLEASVVNMSIDPIALILHELDLYWGAEQDYRAGRSLVRAVTKLEAEAKAEIAGVYTAKQRLRTFLEGLSRSIDREALALLYLGRGDADNWADAQAVASDADYYAFLSKCMESPRSADYIRAGLRKRAAT
jgi:hypothetical protein